MRAATARTAGSSVSVHEHEIYARALRVLPLRQRVRLEASVTGGRAGAKAAPTCTGRSGSSSLLRTAARPASQRLSLSPPRRLASRLHQPAHRHLLRDGEQRAPGLPRPHAPLHAAPVRRDRRGVQRHRDRAVELGAGVFADRRHRQKEVAVAGYGLSALCKLLALWAGSAWDGSSPSRCSRPRRQAARATAPRDALISPSTRSPG